MDNSNLTGSELMEHLPSYLISIHPGGRSVYLMLVILIMMGFVSMPLVSVRVSVSGRGIIRPKQEKARIIASSSGIVSKVYVKEGEMILKNEPLLQIRSIETQKNLHALNTELKEIEIHADDLAGLTSDPAKTPVSKELSREYEEYLHQVEYLVLILTKAESELNRHFGLFQNGLISEKEYSDLEFAAIKARKELENYTSHLRNKWQNQYFQQIAKIRELKVLVRNEEEKIRLTTIHAPATGNMIEFNGIFEGSAIQAGSVIGILSPESGLIGEFYVSSQDIAFLNIGQEVHIHLDAFSAREWGFVSGEIYEISSDFLILENIPVYRIKCRLNRTDLTLRNGYSSKLKKGMTFQARCMVRQRTLLQLLTDKAENWLHPALNRKEFSLKP